MNKIMVEPLNKQIIDNIIKRPVWLNISKHSYQVIVIVNFGKIRKVIPGHNRKARHQTS